LAVGRREIIVFLFFVSGNGSRLKAEGKKKECCWRKETGIRVNTGSLFLYLRKRLKAEGRRQLEEGITCTTSYSPQPFFLFHNFRNFPVE